ncbi:podocalyxin-like protein 2 isoform X2 [Carettochelys insculpta]|uniref:podocalyxin-like protein 2 isoform X2 n=1 Tax=Carettochelys insculpta TaxID=44489 RepID=UPI003EBA074C
MKLRLRRALAVLLAWGTLCICLVSSEEPTAEGLTSTSFVEFTMMSHLEPLDSSEQSNLEAMEPDPVLSALHTTAGSGFASEENGESKIPQPPQYFWEDGGDLNDSILDLGPATASSSLGVVTEAAVERQEEASVPEHTASGFDLGSSMGPSLLPVSSILSVSTAGSQDVSQLPMEVTSGNVRATVRAGVELAGTLATVESTQTPLGEEFEPTELPVGGELMEPTAQVGAEQVEPTVLAGMVQAEAASEVTSPGESFHDPRIVSGTTPGLSNASSSAAPLDGSDKPAPTPFQNGMKLSTESMAAEQSLVPQTGDAHLAELSTGTPWNSPQVVCKDWSNLAGKNYVILNMSDNIDCEEFRLAKGPQLLALLENAFSRQADRLQAQWQISLSKPSENDKHLLMTLAREQGVVPTKDVLMALDYVQRSLAEIGIQNYSTTTSCQSRPSQTHSDYGKLFVVLVIIGSICAIIIIMGLIYNCWQRRLPKMKNVSHGEELRFVENGCHDNPTLDVATDSQSEMQEKKPSVNGGGAINGPDGWDVLITKRADEDADVFEEDTHL